MRRKMSQAYTIIGISLEKDMVVNHCFLEKHVFEFYSFIYNLSTAARVNVKCQPFEKLLKHIPVNIDSWKSKCLLKPKLHLQPAPYQLSAEVRVDAKCQPAEKLPEHILIKTAEEQTQVHSLQYTRQ